MSADKPDDTRSQEPDFAAMWSSDGATRSFSPSATATGLPIDLPFLFAPGQNFGPYLIVRPLGKGGMGQVYEAEETESGRRIAMKILSRGLGDDEERERFLREGQLAASLSHPNTVYVFGTNEVQGFPVIAMELAPGGTLKDLVIEGTPLTPAQAVDAILQVVTGLDAVAALGILHRDIKPSNCFVDRDGRVLVGDFGLSMAAQAAAPEAAGTIMGTPGFASPEQLRGETLDVRSDIYSVGATLYYLLTGRAPFDDKSVVTLITRVATEAPPVVTSFRPDVPARLASVVAKCLAKTPGERYANYPALAGALEPFRTAALTPAPLRRRLLAGFIDNFTSVLPLMPFNMIMGARLGEDFARQGISLVVVLPSLVSSLVYYTILEGRFGCGFGKAILNLRVVDETQTAPGLRRAFLRAVVFVGPPQAVSQALGFLLQRYTAGAPVGISTGNVIASVAGLATVLAMFLAKASMFVTARRANGFAAIHDRLTRTRVVVRPQAIEARQSRKGMPGGGVSAPRPAGDAHIGPYVVTPELKEQLPSVAAAVTVDAYDDRLQRGVWMELLPIGTPALPATRRDLGRPARARWLSGRRAATECWDAYEAVDGQPLMQAIAQPQPWSRVRHWLADLGGEIAEGVKDGSLPLLHVDRVWIGTDDRARLLDWPPPFGTGRANPDPRSPTPELRSPASDLRSAQQFIYGVAAGALRGVHPDEARSQPPSTPLPLPARTVMLSLRDGAVPAADLLGSQVSEVLRTPAAFPRRRRLLQIVFCSLMPVVLAVAVLATVQLQLRSRTADPDAYKLKSCVQQLVTLDRKGKLTAKEQEQRDLIEIYIAEHLHDRAEASARYARALPAMTSLQRESQMAQRALADHPQRSPEQVKKADEFVGRLLVDTSKGLTVLSAPLVMWTLMVQIWNATAGFVAALALIGALVTRSGFTLRAFGAALVTGDGCPATRFHAVRRMIVTWSPLALAALIFNFTPPIKATTPGLAVLYTLPLAIFATGAVWAWRHPSRGIQDRIVGTWIVPR